jgi:hypothetical protein
MITVGGQVCGRQIQDGEPGGTIIPPGQQPIHGHKHCADRWHGEKVAKERKEREAMVQKITQPPGGPVDPRQAEGMVTGSVPLDTPKSSPPVGADKITEEHLNALGVQGYEGVRPASEVPFEEDHPAVTTTNDTAGHATVPPEFNTVRSTLEQRKEEAWAHQARHQRGLLPSVADEGDLVVVGNLPTTGGDLRLSPEDANDLADALKLYSRRADRARLSHYPNAR